MLQSKDINQRPWLIDLNTIDSTNNYATRLLQDGMAHSGLVVYTSHQFAGKGQRGKQWNTVPGDAIAMSLIYCPTGDCDIFRLSFAVPVVVRKVLQNLMPECQVCIKWPNDIYVNNCKLSGILIENTFRGSVIKSSVIGIGINMRQQDFEKMDRSPISVRMITGEYYDHLEIVDDMRNSLLSILEENNANVLSEYQKFLWRKGVYSKFKDLRSNEIFEGVIKGVNATFELEIQTANALLTYQFGTVQFI